MPKPPPQLELVLEHDAFAERLGREFALILLPVLDKSMPQDRCREVADRLALLASRRAKDEGRMTKASALVPTPCAMCDAPVTLEDAKLLCARCSASVRSAGSEG